LLRNNLKGRGVVAMIAKGFNPESYFFGYFANIAVNYAFDELSYLCPQLTMPMRRIVLILTVLLFSLPLAAQLDAGEDQSICKGDTVQLNATGASNFHWTSIPPDPTISNPDISNPTAQPDTTTMYIVTSVDTGVSLVTNGDFELGNVDFTSEYIYNPNSLWNPGTYAIVSDAHTVHPNFFCNEDHTSGNGLMFCANGATTSNTIVWNLTIDSIHPNTDYQLSAWVASLSPIIPAVLQFKINGLQVGQPLTADMFTCTWKQFFETWNSGDDTVASITIIDQNTVDNLNDFALDDIALNELIVQSDTVMVYVSDPPTSEFEMPSALCSEDTSTITYTGNGADTAVYHWNFDDGVIISGNGQGPYRIYWPVAGTKTVSLWVEDSCSSDTTEKSIIINQSPSASVTADATIIPYGTSTTIHGSMEGEPGPLVFEWQPADSLIDPLLPDAETTLLEATTVFLFTVTDESSQCTATDSITITVTGGPLMITELTAIPDTICEGESTDIQLMVSGGSGNYTVTWTSAPPGFNHTGPEMNLTVTPDSITTYYVWVNDGFNTTPQDSIRITVLQQLSISSQPVDAHVVSGQPATFEVIAQNVITYQWQYSSDNGATWTGLTDDAVFSGTTTAQLTIDPATEEMNGWLFRCLLAGRCDPVITEAAQLFITTAPDFITGLQDMEVCEGTLVSVPCDVSGFNGITSLRLVLQFDEQLLEFTGLSDVAPKLSSDIQSVATGSRIEITWNASPAITLEPGTLFNLDFHALLAGASQLTWNSGESTVTNGINVSPLMILNGATVTVNPLPEPPVIVTADPDSLGVSGNETVTLSAEGGSGDELIWTTGNCDGDKIGNDSILQMERPYETETYFAKWANTCGVSNCMDVTVVVAGEYDLYAPNAFSPNNDGLNDEFTLVSPAPLALYHLLIFDRWGKQIYESFDQYQGWNGTYKGSGAPVGVYAWKVTYQLAKTGPGSEKKIKSGTVMLVR